jgi:hypothetical protein
VHRHRVASGLALVVLVALVSACQQGPDTRRAAPAPSPVEKVLADGDALMARKEYAAAIEKYRQAADLDPNSIGARFSLGVAYSFLDKNQETIAQFRWVLQHAAPTSREYQEARQWLLRVGALTEPGKAGTSDSASAPIGADTPGQIIAKTEWPGINPKERLIRGDVSLLGDEPATQDVKQTRPFRLGDLFGFRDLRPGRYRIVAVAEGGSPTLWDQKVTVEAGKRTELTLTAASASVSPSAFPPK